MECIINNKKYKVLEVKHYDEENNQIEVFVKFNGKRVGSIISKNDLLDVEIISTKRQLIDNLKVHKSNREIVQDIKNVLNSIDGFYRIDVMCLTTLDLDNFDTSLIVDIHDCDSGYTTIIYVVSIEIPELKSLFTYKDFQKITVDVLAPMKDKLINSIKKAGFHVDGIEDSYL